MAQTYEVMWKVVFNVKLKVKILCCRIRVNTFVIVPQTYFSGGQ